jgi:hypothetical protein
MLQSLHEAAGTEIETTAAYNPEQNGVVEKTMGILANHTWAILIDSRLPNYCFGEILRTVCTLTNYHPTTLNRDVTPHVRLFKERPPLLKLRSVGCECWKPLPHNPSMMKLHERGNKCFLLEYTQGDHQYRIWNVDNKRVELVRDLH